MHKLITLGISFCLMCCSVSFSYAQQERTSSDAIAEAVQVSFNLNQPDKIYALTSPIFQKKMTGEQFALGMRKFHGKVGDWTSSVFKEQNEKGFNYLAVFENSRQVFSLSLDRQGKIDRLNFTAAPIVIADKTYQVPSNNPLKDALDLAVERAVRPYIQKGNTSGLVLAVMNKGTVRKYSYGSSDRKTRQLPDAEKTIFEIGSVTKTFNTLMLAQEVVAGKMKLNDPINLYLPDAIPPLQFQGRPITLQDLANHTSGLPRLPANIFNGKVDPKDPYKHYTPDSLFSFLKNYHPVVMPGTVFSYSNYGAGVLGTILERKLQLSFEQLILSKICKPLAMEHTSVTLNAYALAQGYNETGEATAPWDLASLKGSGAIRSTLNDMVKYTRAQMEMTGPLAKAITLSHEPTFKGKDQSMGLGWRISQYGRYTYYHHSGGTGGFRSFVGFDPQRQLGIVILSNAAEDVTVMGEGFLK
ncbi:serine hydrolase [Pedobacter sp. MC2016-24]|uniref:serine hydrolase domain-containing protein n=1 Tax=Pedobacter sp. MC2016-24 TaxID=2780090 RepID=UPI0018808E97|nr:serine hydrolase domain-containing protein [Pedobacter sp. MC2016-24]MBE9600290.1 beta-lactamase family protein [Pedobacter sp. MC2016-24]